MLSRKVRGKWVVRLASLDRDDRQGSRPDYERLVKFDREGQ
jgi:hypothetical protein